MPTEPDESDEARAYYELIEADRLNTLEAEKNRAILEMEKWFFRHFEDPRANMPHDGRKIVYPWGGPFNAATVLYENFPSFINNDDWILQAVEGIEAGGVKDWAPVSTGDYYERPAPGGMESEDGLTLASRLGAEIVSRLDALERMIASLPSSPSSIGHNAPPEGMGLPPYTEEDRREVAAAIGAARKEVAAQAPDPDKLLVLSVQFRRPGVNIRRWLAKKADLAVDEAIKRSIQAATFAGAAALLVDLGDDLIRLAEALLAKL